MENNLVFPPIDKKFELWPPEVKKKIVNEFCYAYNREHNENYSIFCLNEKEDCDFSLKNNRGEKLCINHKFEGAESREYKKETKVIGGAMLTWERIFISLIKAKNLSKDVILLIDSNQGGCDFSIEIIKNNPLIKKIKEVWIFNRWSNAKERFFILK